MWRPVLANYVGCNDSEEARTNRLIINGTRCYNVATRQETFKFGIEPCTW
ncbi:hypothetical protein PITC_011830 [Penicillium italicum]|uniref:Uncharacterized protein n=1 Tax=Penicillium italicum TaxID=40296 RepID=A0A0A2LA24_PENIT|nr:hypothetical protein PITC_011830 [Penicillium italicum]